MRVNYKFDESSIKVDYSLKKLKIFLTILFVLVNTNDAVVLKKCCRPDEILYSSEPNSLSCTSWSELKLSRDDFNNPKYYFGDKTLPTLPVCIAQLKEIFEPYANQQLSTCLDEYLVANNNTNALKLIGPSCVTSFLTRNFKGIKKCCPHDEIFDHSYQCIKSRVQKNIINEFIQDSLYYAIIDSSTDECTSKTYDVKEITYSGDFVALLDVFHKNKLSRYSCLEGRHLHRAQIVIRTCKLNRRHNACDNCRTTKYCTSNNKFLKFDSKNQMKIIQMTSKTSHEEVVIKNKKTEFALDIAECKGMLYSHTDVPRFTYDGELVTPYYQYHTSTLCMDYYLRHGKHNLGLFSCVEHASITKILFVIVDIIFFVLNIMLYVYLPSFRNGDGNWILVYMISCLTSRIFTLINDNTEIIFRHLEYYYYFGYVERLFEITQLMWLTIMSFYLWKRLNNLPKIYMLFTKADYVLSYIIGFGFSVVLDLILIMVYKSKMVSSNFLNSLYLSTLTLNFDVRSSSARQHIEYSIILSCFMAINIIIYGFILRRIIEKKDCIKEYLERMSVIGYFNIKKQIYITVHVILGVTLKSVAQAPLIKNEHYGKLSIAAESLNMFCEIIYYSQGIFIFFLFLLTSDTMAELRSKIRNRLANYGLTRNNEEDDVLYYWSRPS